MNDPRRRSGVSLIEMVTVIVVTGILSVGLAGILRHPMQGQAAVSRRAELVDLADLALLRMSRDLRMALPNSVRVDETGTGIELLHVVAGARYRAEPGINAAGEASGTDHTNDSDVLTFAGDARWNLLGRINGLEFAYGTALARGTRIAIYPTGSEVWSAAAANASPAIITAATNQITLHDDGDEDQIALASAHRFSHVSPRARLYLVDSPVSYLCDVDAGVLWRVDGYAITASQPTDVAAAPLASGRPARTAEWIERCRFEYLPGTPSRSGLVTLEIVIASAGERVRLLQQVPIPNAP
jgi:MSHA biogenesis protein MshO